MRTCSAAALAAVLVLSFPVRSGADHIWWIGDEDEFWDTEIGSPVDDTNWLTLSTSNPPGPDDDTQLPGLSIDAYVSDHAGGGHVTFPAVIDAGTVASTRQFYVGGWDPGLANAPSGDPLNMKGVLEIAGGSLQVGECTQMQYTRVGYWGALGTINQSGGNWLATQTISIGWGSADSHGSVNVTDPDAVVRTGGLDVGGAGVGVLNVTAGTVRLLEDGDGTDCEDVNALKHHVGRGYEYPANGDEPFMAPGVGLLTQAGGTITLRQSPDCGSGACAPVKLIVGAEVGSTGVIHLRDQANLAANQLWVGALGHGSLTQVGSATLVVDENLWVGQTVSGLGSYTISGGSLTVGDAIAGGGSFVIGKKGVGRFVIIGGAASIDVYGFYEQGSDARLTVMLDGDADGDGVHISPIEATENSRFRDGTEVEVMITDTANPAWVPEPDDEFVLFRAEGATIASDVTNITLVSSDLAFDGWSLKQQSSGTDEELILYCKVGNPCDT